MQQTGKTQVQVQLGGKGDLLGIVQTTKIWPYAQIRICLGKWNTQNHLYRWKPEKVLFNKKKKKRNCLSVDRFHRSSRSELKYWKEKN